MPVENLISDSPFVDQIIVMGEKRPFLIALIVPEFLTLQGFAARGSGTLEWVGV